MKVKTSRPKAALAAFFAAILMLLLNQVITRASLGGKVDAVKLMTNVQAGQVITSQDVSTVVIHGNVTGLAAEKYVIGKEAVFDLLAGQPVMLGDVSSKPEREGLKPGQVGMRVPVDLVSSAGVVPGDHVDVLISINVQGSGSKQAQSTVEPLIQNVRVVSVVNNSNQEVTKPAATGKGSVLSTGNSELPAAVELALTTQQAQSLALAESTGKIILVQAPWATQSAPTSTEDSGLPQWSGSAPQPGQQQGSK